MGTHSEKYTNIVSVIVPLWKNDTGLRKLVSCLEEQTYPLELIELIIVNNEVDQPIHISSDIISIKIVEEPVLGSYKARNTGVRNASGSIFAFTDSDCMPDPDWIKQGVFFLNETNMNKAVAGNIRTTVSTSPTSVELLDLATVLRQDLIIKQRRYAVTANLFVPKTIMDVVGLFNEELQSGGDREWGHRLRKSQYDFAYSEKAVIRHKARKTFKELRERTNRIVHGLVDYEKEKSGSLLLQTSSLVLYASFSIQNLGIILCTKKLKNPIQRLKALYAWILQQLYCLVSLF